MQQQQPSPQETRNLIIAGVLSLAVMMVWGAFFAPPPPEQPPEEFALEEGAQPTGADRPAPGATVYDHDAALALSERVQIETPALRGSTMSRRVPEQT